MPLSYRILPRRNLVYVRYEGFLSIAESNTGFGQYAMDPDRRRGQHQLVDLRAATGFERDFAALMALQAAKLGVFSRDDADTMFIFLATTPEAYALAHYVAQSWAVVPHVVVRVQTDEAGALELLGQPETTIAALLESVA